MANPFRALPVRFCGHGYAIAAAFGPTIYLQTHDLLTSMGTGYIVLHAIHRSMAAGGSENASAVFVRTVLFDGLASALIPTFLTYHVRLIMLALVPETRIRTHGLRWLPVVVSLASLAACWLQIDLFVDDVLGHPLRIRQ